MSVERVLVDTNIFVYATDTASPHCPAASAFLDAVASGSFIGCVTPQVLLEFVSVVTNPKRVLTVRTTEEAWAAADGFAASLEMIVPPDDLFAQASALAQSLKLAKQDVFDLAIGITALHGGASVVYTFDPSVFARIPGVSARTPAVEPAAPATGPA